MATISDGVTTITPKAKLNAADSYETRNKIHELLGGGVAVTFGAEPLRTGTLEMYFDNETDANNAYSFFKNGFVFQLTDTAAPTTNMYFVLAGSLERNLNMDTYDSWELNVDIQEVKQ